MEIGMFFCESKIRKDFMQENNGWTFPDQIFCSKKLKTLFRKKKELDYITFLS